MKVLAIFIGGLFGFWLMSTALFTLFGAVMVFDSGDWSKLIPFMWGQGFGRAMFGLCLFVISPILSILYTCDTKCKQNNHKVKVNHGTENIS